MGSALAPGLAAAADQPATVVATQSTPSPIDTVATPVVTATQSDPAASSTVPAATFTTTPSAEDTATATDTDTPSTSVATEVATASATTGPCNVPTIPGAPGRNGPAPDPCATPQPERVISLGLVGANTQATVVGQDELPGTANYLVGNDPNQWHTDIPTYASVTYQNVYPGVDMVFHGQQDALEYDFDVQPGSDPRAIQMSIAGADQVSMDAQGDLLLTAGDATLTAQPPNIYQEIDGQQQEVAGQYQLLGGNTIGFTLGSYDTTQPLVIDPVIIYSTYLGGNGSDAAYGLAVDSSGDTYVAGETSSTNFPTANPYQGTLAGNYDAFVSKLNAAGTALVYSTYLGGSGTDQAFGLAVDSSGDAYVTGTTGSTNFPTFNAYQSTFISSSDEAFVSKLNASGNALVYSTYLGGALYTYGDSIAVNGSGNAYVTGFTSCTNFPTKNPYQSSLSGSYDTFVTEFSASGSTLVYSTYFGGNLDTEGISIALDSSGNAYIAGYTVSTTLPTMNPYQGSLAGLYDAFVTKFNASGNALIYSTYLGGSAGSYAGTEPFGIAVDSSGDAYVTGYTNSTNFPTLHAYQSGLAGTDNAFVTKFSAGGNSLVYSTYLGGNQYDWGMGIAVDSHGHAVVTGQTSSSNFPTVYPTQATLYAPGVTNAFISVFASTGNALSYSTYLGGNGTDSGRAIAIDSTGLVHIAGYTTSTNFPTTAGALQPALRGSENAFVVQIQPPSLVAVCCPFTRTTPRNLPPA